MAVFFTVSDKLNYTKKPLTLNEQVSLLEKQGLIIHNKKNGLQFFTNVNYYKFSAYTLPFEEKPKQKR